MPGPIVGLHHVTAIASDPQRNLDFCCEVLGLRFVKRTVKTGMQQDGWTQILTGLMPDETVVTDGAVFLSNKLLLGDAG